MKIEDFDWHIVVFNRQFVLRAFRPAWIILFVGNVALFAALFLGVLAVLG